MKAITDKKTLIAIPYYGTLACPPLGLTRIFFLVGVNLEEKMITGSTIQVWDPKKEPNLFLWLRQLETNGLICSDLASNYQTALNQEGIWVQWGQEGDVEEVVEKWLVTGHATANNANGRTVGDAA